MIDALAVIVAAAAWPQSSPDTAGLRALARDGPDTALVVRARREPDAVREALRGLLVDAAGETADGPALAAARRLAGAWATAWRDPFLGRRVERFVSLSPVQQRATVAADSIRRAGNSALGTDGVEAAIRAWSESVRRFEALRDSAGQAAALGSIGAGYYLAQMYDSAETYLIRARDLAQRIGDHRTAGNAVGTLGSVYLDLGDLRRASELYTKAGELRALTGDARGLAADQNNLGLIAEELGDLAGARRAYLTALAANRSADRAGPAATNLVNLGNIASLEGDYAEAAARYGDALATYRALEHRPDAALVLHNLGVLALRRGDYPGAMTALTEAADTYRETGPAADEIAVRRDLARARAAAGDLQGARDELRRADAVTGRAEPGAALRASLALARADLAVHFNQLAEAEQEYGAAERLARGTGDEEIRAAAQRGIGIVLLIRENYSRAHAPLKLALREQIGSGDRRGAALTRLLMGYAHQQQGDTAGARRALTEALDTLRALGEAVGEATALGALGDLERRGNLGLTAESLYVEALGRLGNRPAPETKWPLHFGLGQALRARGALAEAAEALRAAIAEIESVSAGVSAEERRAAFLTDKWDPYVELALVEHERGRVTAAFDASERLRARQMLDLLARGRIPAGGAGPAPLTEREQDLRRRITELTRQLATPVDGDLGARGARLREADAATREALARAQAAYGELLVEMRETGGDYAALVRGETLPVNEVAAALGDDQILLEYLVGDSTTVVFVVSGDTVAALDLNVSRATLVPLVDFARGTLASPVEGAARSAWRAPLRRLFEYLVAPIEARGLLAGKRRLLIAPHGELHYLPFAALLAPGQPDQALVERYVIEYVPSASVWLRLRQRPAPGARAGVLALAPRADALPGSRAEVQAIGRMRGDAARVLVGAAATERVFRTLAPSYDIVHLATYGVLNKHNPLFSFVELAADESQDGRLEVHEVFGLSLNARLLVLSACQTGLAAGALADVPPGDDWVGLVRAFLFAGASNVLATLWPVEDRSTAGFMERFYGELAAGRREAEALAAVQRATARDPATAHPFYWAGFALVAGR